MADQLQPCCEKARDQYVKRVTAAITSYPVIKDLPCPTCKRIIPVRIYARPRETGDAAR